MSWPIPKPISKGFESIPENALKSVLKVGVMVMTPLSGPKVDVPGKRHNAAKKRRSMSAIEGEKIKRKLKQTSQTMRKTEALVHTTRSTTKAGPDVCTDSKSRINSKYEPDVIRCVSENRKRVYRHGDGRKRRAKPRRNASTVERVHKSQGRRLKRSETFGCDVSELKRSSTELVHRKPSNNTAPPRRMRRSSSAGDILSIREGGRIRRCETFQCIVPEYRKPMKRSGSAPSLDAREEFLKKRNIERPQDVCLPFPPEDYRKDTKKVENLVEEPAKSKQRLTRENDQRIQESPKASLDETTRNFEHFTARIANRPGTAIRESRDEPDSSTQTEALVPKNDVFIPPAPVPPPIWNAKKSGTRSSSGDALQPDSLVHKRLEEKTPKEELQPCVPDHRTGPTKLSASGSRGDNGSSRQPRLLSQNSDVIIPPPPPPLPPPPLPPSWNAQMKDSESKWSKRPTENGCVVKATTPTVKQPTNADHEEMSGKTGAKGRNSSVSQSPNTSAVERKKSFTRSRVEHKIMATQSINKNQPCVFASGMGYRTCMPELEAVLQKRQVVGTE